MDSAEFKRRFGALSDDSKAFTITLTTFMQAMKLLHAEKLQAEHVVDIMAAALEWYKTRAMLDLLEGLLDLSDECDNADVRSIIATVALEGINKETQRRDRFRNLCELLREASRDVGHGANAATEGGQGGRTELSQDEGRQHTVIAGAWRRD